jgi:hypothetical protein
MSRLSVPDKSVDAVWAASTVNHWQSLSRGRSASCPSNTPTNESKRKRPGHCRCQAVGADSATNHRALVIEQSSIRECPQ